MSDADLIFGALWAICRFGFWLFLVVLFVMACFAVFSIRSRARELLRAVRAANMRLDQISAAVRRDAGPPAPPPEIAAEPEAPPVPPDPDLDRQIEDALKQFARDLDLAGGA